MEQLIGIKGQSFSSHADWVNRATEKLTRHPEYNNTEHNGPASGWRGYHFTAMCFDQKGRRCRNGSDFDRATKDGSYPIWWVWPDQIAALIIEAKSVRSEKMKQLIALKRLAEIVEDDGFPSDLTGPEMGFHDTSAAVIYDSFSGSMGAALSLHQRALGKMSQYSIVTDPTCGRVTVTFWPDGLSSGRGHSGAAWFDGNPARAWLLAIVRAKISVLEDE